jgi:glucose-6-phosphate isomerase, archaeal
MISKNGKPYTYNVISNKFFCLSKYDNHITRRLSDMKGQFWDVDAYNKILNREDTLLYEVYELLSLERAGELRHGISIIHPGLVGKEYYMTKGHFHSEIETAEVYYCLQGEGYMVMETPEGEWSVELLQPQKVLYVPPRWAHRSININLEIDLVTLFIYPGNAGHDYRSIEKQGFRKLVIFEGDAPRIIDNPRWLPPEKRT